MKKCTFLGLALCFAVFQSIGQSKKAIQRFNQYFTFVATNGHQMLINTNDTDANFTITVKTSVGYRYVPTHDTWIVVTAFTDNDSEGNYSIVSIHKDDFMIMLGSDGVVLIGKDYGNQEPIDYVPTKEEKRKRDYLLGELDKIVNAEK